MPNTNTKRKIIIAPISEIPVHELAKVIDSSFLIPVRVSINSHGEKVITIEYDSQERKKENKSQRILVESVVAKVISLNKESLDNHGANNEKPFYVKKSQEKLPKKSMKKVAVFSGWNSSLPFGRSTKKNR